MEQKANTREIVVTTKDNKKQKGTILFLADCENERDKLLFYEMKGQLFVSKLLENDQLVDLSASEWEAAEKIYQSYIKQEEEPGE